MDDPKRRDVIELLIAPTIACFDGTRAAYRQTGNLAYALTGNTPENALERGAIQPARKLL